MANLATRYQTAIGSEDEGDTAAEARLTDWAFSTLARCMTLWMHGCDRPGRISTAALG